MSAPAAHGRALAEARRPGRPPRTPRNVDPVIAAIWAAAQTAGMTRAALAERAGVDPDTVGLLVAGRRGGSLHTARMLAAAVGCRLAVVPDDGGAR